MMNFILDNPFVLSIRSLYCCQHIIYHGLQSLPIRSWIDLLICLFIPNKSFNLACPVMESYISAFTMDVLWSTTLGMTGASTWKSREKNPNHNRVLRMKSTYFLYSPKLKYTYMYIYIHIFHNIFSLQPNS